MERFKESLHIAFANLLTNLARSILSITGIVIGIAAVIAILSLGAGVKEAIIKNIENMGAHTYSVSGNFDETTRRMGNLGLEDINKLEELPFVISAIPQLNIYKEIRSRAKTLAGVIRGADSGYMNAKNLRLIKGRSFSPIEFETRKLVCVINRDGAEQLLLGREDREDILYFDDTPWTVIGVYTDPAMEQAKAYYKGRGRANIEILAPLPALIRNTKNLTISTIDVHVRTDAENVEAEIKNALARGDPQKTGLYSVFGQQEIINQQVKVNNMLSLIGALVAGISLLVGGIGMMNVMLTAVAERTREIGIRRAVGAKRNDILFQFLTESCLLSVIGGVIGLINGAALAKALPILMKDKIAWSARIEPTFLIFAVGTGVLLGVVFGFYPAVKASKLLPAEALRSE